MPHTIASARQEWQAFWLALGFLTRVPMLIRIEYTQTLMNQSSVYFPLIGLLLGAVYAGLFSALSLLFSPLICLIMVVSAHLWLTGAFHEDGLADSMDALGGGYTVEARLHIMKDSRIGTYGTVALVLALALKVALLMETSNIGLALLISPCLARLTPLVLMRCMNYVTDPDTSKSKPVAEGFSRQRLWAAFAFAALVALAAEPWAPGLLTWSALSIGLVAWLWGRNLKQNLGGYTGDALGASVVFTELALLACLTV